MHYYLYKLLRHGKGIKCAFSMTKASFKTFEETYPLVDEFYMLQEAPSHWMNEFACSGDGSWFQKALKELEENPRG